MSTNTWNRYRSEPTSGQQDPFTSARFGPAVLSAIQDPRLRGYLVDKSVPWDAVDMPVVTALPVRPKDRAEVTLLVNDWPTRMFYLQATDKWYQLGPPPVVTTLPTDPVDGLTVQITADGTDGVVWTFRYNDTSSSSYKWEFVGGPPLLDEVVTSEIRSSATYGDLATSGPAVTLPLAGDYDVTVNAWVQHGAAADDYLMSYAIGGTAASDTDAYGVKQAVGVGALTYPEGGRTRRKTGLTAVTLTAKYRSAGANACAWTHRVISASPVRVG